MKMSQNKAKVGLLSLLSIFSILGLSISATILTTSSTPVSALCASVLKNGNFQATSEKSLWKIEGQVDIPPAKNGFALVKNQSGWSGIRQRVRLSKGSTYRLTAKVRTSENLTDGYFGFRDAQQQPVSEIKFNHSNKFNNSHRNLTVVFRPKTDGYYYVFAGLWATNGDTWMYVSDVNVSGGTCNDT
jgi:hypothetical protein